MALFGKKKHAATPAPETVESLEEDTLPEPGAQADTGEAFDFDAVARDLGASDGPSPFDELLANSAQSQAENSAFDSPDGAPFEDKADETPTFATSEFETPAARPDVPDENLEFDTIFDDGDAVQTPELPFAAPAGIDIEPVVPPAESLAEAQLHTPPMLTSDIVAGVNGAGAPKKALPLVPLLGAGAVLLALAGAGWWTFGRPAPEPEEAPVVVSRKPKPVTASNPPLRAPANPAPDAATSNAMETDLKTPVLVPAMGNAASPGVPPAKGAAPPPKIAPRAVIVPPARKAQLKALWKKGADAKHRGDNAGARKAWQQALKLQPGHPGFQDAIDKLPPA